VQIVSHFLYGPADQVQHGLIILLLLLCLALHPFLEGFSFIYNLPLTPVADTAEVLIGSGDVLVEGRQLSL
jgi:hypothetical protein